MFQTLISATELSYHLEDPDWVLIDCRFDLANPALGAAQYEAGHIPGASYAHLDHDLSSQPVTDRGRHPLPSPAELRRRFGRMGIDSSRQVVVYDGDSGVYASRLWWMLHYMGHEAAAVLEGGWAAWQSTGLPEASGQERAAPVTFEGEPKSEMLVLMSDVANAPLLIDARSPVRFSGEEEPIDPKPGHIPGAVNYFYGDNLTADNHYLAPEQLRQHFKKLLGETPAAETVFYCGSGVSACADILAMVHAGLGHGRLYVGSWSEWSSYTENPTA